MSDIDELDRRAEEIANKAQFSSESSSSAKSEETNESWAKEAAVTAKDAEDYMRNKRRYPKIMSKRAPRKKRKDEDKEAALDADWSDLEDERNFLENDHKTKFLDLLHRFEHELPEDGDVVDVYTGRIVESRGHLNALKPVGPLLFSIEPDEEEEGTESDDSRGQGSDNDSDNEMDILVTCCDDLAPALNEIIFELR